MRRFFPRNGLARDHVFRPEKQTSMFIRRIWKYCGHPAINNDIRLALSQTKIMNADVTRAIPVNVGSNAMSLAKISDDQRRKRTVVELRLPNFEFAVGVCGHEKFA